LDSTGADHVLRGVIAFAGKRAPPLMRAKIHDPGGCSLMYFGSFRAHDTDADREYIDSAQKARGKISTSTIPVEYCRRAIAYSGICNRHIHRYTRVHILVTGGIEQAYNIIRENEAVYLLDIKY
jgi:hypothetical protein